MATLLFLSDRRVGRRGILAGKCCLNLLEADALAIRPEQDALQPVFHGHRPEADGFDFRPRVDKGQERALRGGEPVGRLVRAKRVHLAAKLARDRMEPAVGRLHEAVDRAGDHGVFRIGRTGESHAQ